MFCYFVDVFNCFVVLLVCFVCVLVDIVFVDVVDFAFCVYLLVCWC